MNETQGPAKPPEYASYPRGREVPSYCSSEKLTRLYRGYLGMNYTYLLLLITVICYVGSIKLSSSGGSEALVTLFTMSKLVSLAVGLFFGVRSCIDIGIGMGWHKGVGVMLGVLIPIIGILVIAVMHHLAIKEMKEYGIHKGTNSPLKRKNVKSKIAQLAAMEIASQPVTPGFFTPQ